MDKIIDEKNEELSLLSNNYEILKIESVNKDQTIEQLQEKNQSLEEKNKKWMTRIDTEIEKNQ